MNERYEKGKKRLEEMNNSSSIGPMLDSVAPDLNRFIKEFAFGDIHSREGLDKKQRELIIIASLTTLGYAGYELESHINMALNVGWTKDEIIEAIMQVTVYAGFPAAVNGMKVAKQVFESRASDS